MTPAELKKDIRSGTLCGAYLLYGEEDYLKNHYLKEIRSEIIPGGDVNDLNYIRFDSENYEISKFASAVETLPCFSEKKLIEVSELDFNAMSDAELASLCETLSALDFYDYNTVVFFVREHELDIGKYRGKQLVPSKTMKSLMQCTKPVCFEYEQPAKLCAWIEKHFTAENIKTSQSECKLIIELCGSDMYTLSSEISKLCAYVRGNGRDTLSSDDIRTVVIQNKEYGAFAFANAILSGDIDMAYAVLDKMKERREKPEYILSSVSTAFSNLCLVKALLEAGLSPSEISSKLKMHEYTVSLYIRSVQNKSSKKLSKLLSRCYDADIKIKTTSLDSEEVLDKLVASTVGL